MHDVVTAESGGSLADESVEAEAAGGEIVTLDPNVSSGMMGNDIELEEFQPRPQSTERMSGPSVSLVHM